MARNDRRNRDERERARLYEARRRFHDDRVRRRSRDNLVAGVGGAVVLAGGIALQTVYFTTGPGAPTPDPAETVVSEPTPTATDIETVDPTPSTTP